MNTKPKSSLRVFFAALAIIGALLQSLSAAPPSAIGQRVVTNATVNVRQTANGTILGTQPSGRQGTVTAGPTTTGGYTWWNINFDSSTLDGWVASIGIDVIPPNLVPSNYTISPNSGPAGTSVSVSFQINNTGGSAAAGFTTNMRLSTSSTAPSTSDPLLAQITTPSLAVGSTANANLDVTIPAGTSSGTKYIWVIVDVNNTSGQTSAEYGDDRIYRSFSVTVPPNAPSGLVAFATENLVSLAWNDNSSNETGFKIERKTGAGGTYSQKGTTGQDEAAYIDNSISPGNTYYYRVRAYNGAGDSAYSNEFSITPQRAPDIDSVSPSPVIGSASQQTVTINGSYFVNKPTITLTWTGQSGYTVPASQVTYVNSSQVEMAITVGNTRDTWTVKATNPDGQVSNIVSFLVEVPPGAPTVLETQAFSDRVELGWFDNSNNETGFKIERKTGNGSYSQIATTGSNGSSAAYYTDNSTAVRTTYTYRVRAYNAAGDSAYTNAVTLTTPGGPPGAFTLSNDPPVWDASIPGPKVQLNWTPSSDVGNYAVYRNGTVYVAGIAGTSYLNSANLTGGVTYSYFIRASNADGTTDSNTITVTMPTAPQDAPAAPSGLAASVTASLVSLAWNDNSNNESGFRIERKTGAAGTWAEINTTAQNVAAYIDNAVSTGTTYYYRVRAYNGGGNSGYSNERSATPAGPTSLGSFTLSNQAPYWDSSAPAGPAIQLSWTPSNNATAYDVYRNGVLYSTNLTGTSFLNNVNLNAGQTYNFYVVAKNGTLTRQSNTVQATMPTAPPTSPATLTSVTLTGPSQVAPGQSAQFECVATYSDGRQENVTESAIWSLGGVVPGGTVIVGGSFRAGQPGTPTTVLVKASFESAYVRRDGSLPVTIGDQFSVAIGLSMQLLAGNSYTVNLQAYPSGGTTPISYVWDTDQDGQFDDLSGVNPTFVLVANGVPRRISVRATDALARVATFRVNVPAEKPTTAGQPVKYAPASSVGASSFLNGSGQAFDFDLARTGNGLIVICHGADDDGKEDWVQDLMANIEARIPAASRPNVFVYDWSEDASPAPTLGDLFGFPDLPAEVEDTADITKMLAELTPQYRKFAAFLEKVALKGQISLAEALKDAGFRRFAKAIRSVGLDQAALLLERYDAAADGLNFAGNFLIAQAHAQILVAALETEAASLPQRVDFSKPIHFIGDGEGGWLLAEAALLLKDRSHYVDRVTTLDTTLLMKYHAEELAGPGYFERIISSAPGDFFWPVYYLPSSNPYRSSVDIRSNGFLYLTSGLPWFHHERARKWYRDSALPTAELANSGFYYSPFVNGPKIPKSGAPLAASLAISSASSSALSAMAVSGFSTFGSVTTTAEGYAISENGDAGIFKTITLPPGATKLEFKFRFSGATDGDVLGVRFGTRPELYLGLDTALSRTDFHRASVFIGRYASQTDDLIFTLVSRGANGATLEIKDIQIVETEDPDEDGLDNATELAAGTNTWLPDSDWDGFDDAYEINVSLTNPLVSDTDGDGVSDPQEALAGTNPNASASVFRVKETTRNADGSITLRWSSEMGKTYRVVMSSSPGFETFESVATKLTGASPLTTFTVPSSTVSGMSSAFFRVEVE